MSRLANKSFTGRAPQTAGAVPELPDFSPQLAELPGGTETNAAMQRWWDLVSQRIEFNNAGTSKRFFEVKAEFVNADTSLSAEITEERVVRADADSALAFDILTVSATVNGLSATVTTLSAAMATAEGYLEARWTINVSAGPIVTGMTLFSASGPDTNVSYIAFQADRFQVNTASSGNKQIFSATATEVKLGNVFTVDLASSKIFMGTGAYANANTYFYVDTVSGGRMSLGSKFVWDGSALTIDGSITATTGTIGGWTIGATTLTGGNATLSSAGTLVLGTANDVVYLSANDATYRLWVGNVTAATAAFSVTKAGALFATGGTFSGAITSTSGTIGGFTIGATTLSATNGGDSITINSSGGGFIQFESTGSSGSQFGYEGMTVTNPAGNFALQVRADTGAGNYGVVWVYDGSGNITVQAEGNTGVLSVTGAFRGPTGSAGAPTFSITGDTDTGIYSTGANSLAFSTGGLLRGYFDASYNFVVTNGTVNSVIAVDTGANRMTVGTSTNHSIQFLTNSALTWLIGTDTHLKTNGGDIRKLSSDGWTPKLNDGTSTIEFQASGGQIFGRINGGAAILLG